MVSTVTILEIIASVTEEAVKEVLLCRYESAVLVLSDGK